MLSYDKSLRKYSRRLRKNMTDAEILLWQKLRRKQLKGLQFYRPKPIGKYIVDYYCPEAKLIIELDGGQHYLQAGKEADFQRDSYFVSLGLGVLRFSDIEVMKELEAVMEKIWTCL